MKALFLLIHLGLGAIVIFQGMLLYETYKPPRETAAVSGAETGQAPVSKSGDKGKTKGKSGRPAVNQERAIVKRNLFKVLTDKPTIAKAPGPSDVKPELEKTQLRLSLWGTVAGNDESDCWAVIEDQAKRKQMLYRVGEQVRGATIKAIYRNRVILTLNGKDQVLEAGTGKKKSPQDTMSDALAAKAGAANALEPRPVKIPVDIKAPGDLVRTMKTRPYLKNGKPAGLLVYGVRPNSDVMALGLKNGDIIRTINGMEITSPDDLDTIAAGLDASPDISISLLRRGQSQNVVFNGETQAFTTQAAKE